MTPSKWLILIGLVGQASAAAPPAWLLWKPEKSQYAGETGIPVAEEDRLTNREKRLIGSGLALLFVGTAVQVVGLLVGP